MKSYINILFVHFKLWYEASFIRKRYTKSLIKELNAKLAPYHQQLTTDQLKRIHVYTLVGFYMNSCLAVLRGKKMSIKEIKNTLHFSVLTLLLDDLTDILKLSSSEILALLNSDRRENDTTILLPKYLYEQIMEQKNNLLFHKTFKQVLIAQDESLQQLGKGLLTHDQLNSITADKGGVGTIMFRLMLNHPFKEKEKDAIYSLGQILQLTNDMFDVYKDTNNGQQTLFTNANNIAYYEQEYYNLIHNMLRQFYTLDYDPKAISNCLFRLSIIPVLGKVCLKQLNSCQAETDGKFEIDRYSRRQLVCDMERWANRRKYINLSIQYYRQVSNLK